MTLTPLNRFFKKLGKRFSTVVVFLRAVYLGPKATFDSIALHGSQQFIARTCQALDLLRQQAPETYRLTQRYIYRIVLTTRSGVFTSALRWGPTIIMRGPRWDEGSLIEYAAAIAHEVYHCELFMQFKEENPRVNIPHDAYGSEKEETLCLEYQCQVLRRLGADEETIQRTAATIATRWWEVPVEEQDW